jgi:hypothetical protein
MSAKSGFVKFRMLGKYSENDIFINTNYISRIIPTDNEKLLNIVMSDGCSYLIKDTDESIESMIFKIK